MCCGLAAAIDSLLYFPTMSTSQDLQAAVLALYSSSSSQEQRSAASHWLNDFAATDGAWQVLVVPCKRQACGSRCTKSKGVFLGAAQ